jgi:hypothetical protein
LLYINSYACIFFALLPKCLIQFFFKAKPQVFFSERFFLFYSTLRLSAFARKFLFLSQAASFFLVKDFFPFYSTLRLSAFARKFLFLSQAASFFSERFFLFYSTLRLSAFARKFLFFKPSCKVF